MATSVKENEQPEMEDAASEISKLVLIKQLQVYFSDLQERSRILKWTLTTSYATQRMVYKKVTATESGRKVDSALAKLIREGRCAAKDQSILMFLVLTLVNLAFRFNPIMFLLRLFVDSWLYCSILVLALEKDVYTSLAHVEESFSSDTEAKEGKNKWRKAAIEILTLMPQLICNISMPLTARIESLLSKISKSLHMLAGNRTMYDTKCKEMQVRHELLNHLKTYKIPEESFESAADWNVDMAIDRLVKEVVSYDKPINPLATCIRLARDHCNKETNKSGDSTPSGTSDSEETIAGSDNTDVKSKTPEKELHETETQNVLQQKLTSSMETESRFLKAICLEPKNQKAQSQDFTINEMDDSKNGFGFSGDLSTKDVAVPENNFSSFS